MATLNSPLDALALEYATFGVLSVVNNVWTWIAVVTAAVSFWRIRATTSGTASSSPEKFSHGNGLLEALTSSKSEDEIKNLDEFEPQAMADPVQEFEAIVKSEVPESSLYDDGVTKGKLTMYIDGESYVNGELTAAIKYRGDVNECDEWWEKWERVVRMRNGDDGWYRYLDLTVINGSVVRLWDANLEKERSLN